MNTNNFAKNLSTKKLKSFRFFSKNLPPTTYHLLPSPRNLQPTTYNLKPSRGFTLVEMLVSISVFMVVMLVAASSLLSIIDANNKAQSLKSAINNLNFALESMQKNIRVGTNYTCNYGGTSSCPNGDIVMDFKSYKDLNDDTFINDYVTYRFNGSSIERCISVNSSCLNGGAFTKLTAPEVKITYMKFYVNNSSQPRVLITISGEAGNKERIKTNFNLQTTVSQRAF